jgi:hypothetical protein
MRHLHPADMNFLAAFHDDQFARATPLNAVAVLSRADELGASEPDGMAVAWRVADRYSADPRLRRLCQTVVPLAGLLAEGGATLRQDHFDALRSLAEGPADELEELLVSVDRFAYMPSSVGLHTAARTDLLTRFGMFGIRLAVELIRAGQANNASELGRALIERSGLAELRSALETHFAARRDVLKAHAALRALEVIIREHPHARSEDFTRALEAIREGSHEFVEIRLAAAIRSGEVDMNVAEADDAERLLGLKGSDPATRLGLAAHAGPVDILRAAESTLERWQRVGAHPLRTRSRETAAAVLVRTCEGILADAAPPR